MIAEDFIEFQTYNQQVCAEMDMHMMFEHYDDEYNVCILH